EFILFDHDTMAERHALADTDHILELVEEVEEFDRAFVAAILRLGLAVVFVTHDATGRAAATSPKRSRSTAATFGGTNPETSPPSAATSRMKLELTNELRDEVIRQTTSISGAR